jgi:serine/threonine protein kinase
VTVGRATTTTVGGFSLDHVAPDLLAEEKSSARSDVYSLGTTAWELLAEHPPFRRTGDVSVGTVIKRIMTQPLPDLPDVPDGVLALLRDMTARTPARVQTMTGVARRTRELARELSLPLHTDLGLPSSRRSPRDPRRSQPTSVSPQGAQPTTPERRSATPLSSGAVGGRSPRAGRRSAGS